MSLLQSFCGYFCALGANWLTDMVPPLCELECMVVKINSQVKCAGVAARFISIFPVCSLLLEDTIINIIWWEVKYCGK